MQGIGELSNLERERRDRMSFDDRKTRRERPRSENDDDVVLVARFGIRPVGVGEEHAMDDRARDGLRERTVRGEQCSTVELREAERFELDCDMLRPGERIADGEVAEIEQRERRLYGHPNRDALVRHRRNATRCTCDATIAIRIDRLVVVRRFGDPIEERRRAERRRPRQDELERARP